LGTLTKEIADESNTDGSRMLAAVIFKNFIANRGGVSKTHKLIDLLKDQRYENYWINLDGVFKE
jgi:hypothetical protein